MPWQTLGMRTRVVTVPALFVVLSTIVACGGGDASDSTTTMAALVTTIAPPSTTVPPSSTSAPATSPPTTTPPSTSVAPSTTVTATSSTSTSVPAAAALVLRQDGLGDAMFGADPDEVVAYVSAILGPPTADSGWADPLATFGVCPGTEVRGVTWGDLQLLFGDDSVVQTGRRHFFNYVYGPPYGPNIDPAGMRTDLGIGIGSTVGELRAAYPGVQVYPEEIYGPFYVVNEDLTGFLTGVTDDDTVISVIGGIPCGE
jgi:hypothetical protein